MSYSSAKNENRWPILLTGFFVAIGLWPTFFFVHDWATTMPLLVFYAVLVTNTYYSVRFFSPLNAPGNITQRAIDILLIALYILMAMNFSNSRNFLIVATTMFAVATLKYVLMRQRNTSFATLARKIRIDIVGLAACGLALMGVIFIGHTMVITWILAIANAAVNIYVLWIHPIYRPVADRPNGS